MTQQPADERIKQSCHTYRIPAVDQSVMTNGFLGYLFSSDIYLIRSDRVKCCMPDEKLLKIINYTIGICNMCRKNLLYKKY